MATFLHYLFRFLQLATGQPKVYRELNLRLQPELGFAFSAHNMNMLARLLPREEKESESLFSVNSGCHIKIRKCMIMNKLLSFGRWYHETGRCER